MKYVKCLYYKDLSERNFGCVSVDFYNGTESNRIGIRQQWRIFKLECHA